MKFNALIPELSVSNIQQSKSFYLDVLGFKLEYERVDDRFAFLSFQEAQLMIEEVNGYWATGELSYPFGRGLNFQIATVNIEGVIQRLKEHDVPLFRELNVNRLEGVGETFVVKEILVQDPDGYLLRFSETVVE